MSEDQGRFRYFEPGAARFWTPAWDHIHAQPRDVLAVRMASGTWREFDSMVSEAEADDILKGAEG